MDETWVPFSLTEDPVCGAQSNTEGGLVCEYSQRRRHTEEQHSREQNNARDETQKSSWHEGDLFCVLPPSLVSVACALDLSSVIVSLCVELSLFMYLVNRPWWGGGGGAALLTYWPTGQVKKIQSLFKQSIVHAVYCICVCFRKSFSFKTCVLHLSFM